MTTHEYDKPSLHLRRTDTFEECKKKIEEYVDALFDDIDLNNDIAMSDDGCSDEAIEHMREHNLRCREETRQRLLATAADLATGKDIPSGDARH
jgi:hypothetical protein